jgi:hypothetical protein
MSPTFSPDGRRVAFIVGSSIRAVSLGGEPPLTVAADGAGAFGLAWAEDGYIYADHDSFIGRVPETGGTVEQVSRLDSLTAEIDHGWPHALPGGRGVLITVLHSPTGDATRYDLAVLEPETGAHRVLRARRLRTLRAFRPPSSTSAPRERSSPRPSTSVPCE